MKKKIRYNCYLKDLFERKRNKKLLQEARNILKEKSSKADPLISVLIPTYNRPELLTQRTIPSVLKQTYQNFEIIIVGDHCTDNTEELINNFNDERIKFYNLPERGEYPTKLHARWQVAGVVPASKAIDLSVGDWIAPLDDDDEFTEDHLEVLLKFAVENNYEMVYGKAKWEIRPGEWVEVGSCPLEHAKIAHLSVLYSAGLEFFKYDIDAWKWEEPADWNLWRRMKEAGVRVGFIDKIVGIHYLEKTQRGV
ncbi:glycosyltransferase family 2 protein [Patescibacteria group bacterium]|nr:glycosyltransferase family 2 protein [Patescibacteria group bacterium]